jgi:hypothetical protein
MRRPGLVLPLGLSLACLGACGQAQPGTGADAGSGSTASGGAGGTPKLEVPSDGGAGSGDGTGGTQVTTVMGDCARTTVTASDTSIAEPADIIFLVDTSGSMLDEIGFVQANLNAFSERLGESGVDTRVIMIAETIPADVPEDMRDTVAGVCVDPPLGSGSCPEDTLLPHYVHIERRVGGADALDVLMSTKDAWIEHMRPGTLTAIVAVSDADAAYPQSIIYGDPPRWEDIDFMSEQFFNGFAVSHRELLEPWTLNGVFAFSECEYSEGAGALYTRLVEMTGGVAGDLCEQDFEPIFENLAASVLEHAVTLACEWELPTPEAGQTFSTELVQVTRTFADGATEELIQVPSEAECLPGGWYFDDPTNPSRVLACPETCDALQSNVEGALDVVFGCDVVAGCAASGAGTLAEGPGVDVCTWPMPEAEAAGTVVDQDSLNVRYVTQTGFGVLLGRVDDASACASVDRGFYYDDPEQPTSIVACPSTCETLQATEPMKVEALFGCKTKDAVVR